MFAQARNSIDPAWAWAAHEPDARRPWNLRRAAHLYRRAAFGADWTQLQQALADGPQQTVDKLLRPQANVDAFNRTRDNDESIAAGSIEGLQAWWLRRMIETPHPLLEKMTLFWHGYFATHAAAVKNPRLMQQHVRLLRAGALGSFSSLLGEMARDPALLTCLGADANRKVLPNENFVRPLMEVFTLGPGQFTEDDVREAARAFTGWFVLRGQLRYIPREHDDTAKRLLGRQGDFGVDDVVRILLEQPATARTVVRKLYRWLISETEEPEEVLIAPLAASFAGDYNVSRLVETMLRSNVFFSEPAYRQRIKSPVEFAVGIVRALEGMVSTTQLARDLVQLGQDLCHPPTVHGWPGGQSWINTATITARHNLSLSLLQGDASYGDKLDPWAVAQRHDCTTPVSAAELLLGLFLQDDGAPRQDLAAAGDPKTAMRGFTHTVTIQPEFHLA